jgi:hypothetical protein
LLQDPCCSGMTSDIEVQDAAPTMLDDEEAM